MKTLTDLKRALKIGKKVKLIFRNREKITEEKTVVRVQSNGLYFRNSTDNESIKGRFLDYPKATLLEFTEKGFRIYNKGLRPLTPEEQKIRDNMPKDKKQSEIDILTDGSTMYWREKAYFKQNNAEYLMGTVTERGMRYDYNTGMVLDDNVKGELMLEYEFVD